MTLPGGEPLCRYCARPVSKPKKGRRYFCGKPCWRLYWKKTDRTRPRYSKSTRLLALEFLRQGWSCRKVASELGVHFTTAARWGREDYHRRLEERQARLVG